MTKASDTWLKLGERPKDSWMGWFYAKGESLMDRIEYEEWALKGVHEGRGVRIAKPGEKQERIEASRVSWSSGWCLMIRYPCCTRRYKITLSPRSYPSFTVSSYTVSRTIKR